MTTRTLVLQQLRSARAAGVSGEAIARQLGVSRVTVAKHVAALRALGYEITARAGEGYRLECSPDLPLPEEVAPLVTDRFWACIDGRAETGSTNDDARALAEAGAPEGTAVLAASQTSGRGRFARVWDSPSGGVYLSVILRPRVAALELGTLPLVIALGVLRGVRALGAEAQLKWPNDVLVDGGKLAGVLLEMSGQAERIEWVVAGVGINVAARGASPGAYGDAGQPDRAREGRAGLAEQLPDITTAAVAAAALDGIAGAYRVWSAEGFVPSLSTEFERAHALTGRRVDLRGLDGAILASGSVAGIDGFGRLRLVTAQGERTFVSGDVSTARR